MNNRDAPLVTIEHARALDALAREGSLQAAARSLNKGHPAVLYLLRSLEDVTGLTILDRSGYRLKLTAEGQRVLAAMRVMLEAERNVRMVVEEAKTGWEARLRVVFDGVFPSEPLLRVVGELARQKAPTQIEVIGEFLSGVEAAFVQRDADLMISVLPVSSPGVVATLLPSLSAHLVAHRSHPLSQKKAVTIADMSAYVLLTVRGSDPRLELSTAGLEPHSSVTLNDFMAKKAAILSAIGYGWMPDYLIARELERGSVRELAFDGGARHEFRPRLYRKKGRRLGRAAAAVVLALATS